MAEGRTVNGLVIRAVDSGEHDRFVTLLTEGGTVSVSAKGARSLRSRYMPACRPYVWGNYEIASRGGSSWLRDASVEEPFAAIGKSISALYLASYITEVCYEMSYPGVESGELLRLALNSLYALDRKIRPEAVIKAVFEIRAAVIAGYMPDLTCCRVCGREPEGRCFLDVMNGGLLCAECAQQAPKLPPDAPAGAVPTDGLGTRSILMPLTSASLEAWRYVAGAEEKKIYAFDPGSRADAEALARSAQTYLLSHLERSFPSLKIYYEVCE